MMAEMRTCKHCKAYYRVGDWYTGYYDNGTANKFTATGKIDDNKCPVCRKVHDDQ